MRRKSTRNAQKETPTKEETEPAPKTRRSKRRKRTPSKSSDTEEEVTVVTKRAPVVEETPDTTTKSHSPTDEELSQEPVWKVTSSEETPRGEIQKLKICLTRPAPDSPDKMKTRRSKSSSQTEDDSEEKTSGRRSRSSRGSSHASRNDSSQHEGDDDAEEKKGKGKSKGKHKSKIEKSPRLNEPEIEKNSDISGNAVQVTRQSPTNVKLVDNDDHKIVNDTEGNDKNDQNTDVAQAKDSDSDDDEPLSVIKKVQDDKMQAEDVPETKKIELEQKEDALQVKEVEKPETQIQEKVTEEKPKPEQTLQQNDILQVESVPEESVTLPSPEKSQSVIKPTTEDEHKEEQTVALNNKEDKQATSQKEKTEEQSVQDKKEPVQVEEETKEQPVQDIKEPVQVVQEAGEQPVQDKEEPVQVEKVEEQPVEQEKEKVQVEEEPKAQSSDVEMTPVTEEETVAEEPSLNLTAEECLESEDTVMQEQQPKEVSRKRKASSFSLKLNRENYAAHPQETTFSPNLTIAKIKREWKCKSNQLETLNLEDIETLFPSLEFPEEPDLKVEIKEPRKSTGESSKKYERKVSVESTDEVFKKVAEKPEQDTEENTNIIAFNRKISIVEDTASKLRPPPSPAKNETSEILFVSNLVRPFTIKQLRELLERTGKLVDDGFWTDKIKSKCYVRYETKEDAEATRNALHGVQWPIGNGKKLIIDYASIEEMENARNPPTPPPPVPAPVVPVEPVKTPTKEVLESLENKPRSEEKPTKEERRKIDGPVREWDIGKKDFNRERSRSRSRDRTRKHKRTPSPYSDYVSRKQRKVEDSAPQKMMDDLFLKTKATPSIYWQPLSPEEISMKQQQRLIRMEEHKRRMEENTRSRGRDVGRGAFRRRYD